MNGPGVTYKSYLTPMVHVYKNSSGHITRRVLCYRPSAKTKLGKADHKYDPELCGWQRPLEFTYIGPVLCCTRCHRHIYGRESYDRCPQCGRKLEAQATGLHVGYSRGVPTGGTIVARTYS